MLLIQSSTSYPIGTFARFWRSTYASVGTPEDVTSVFGEAEKQRKVPEKTSGTQDVSPRFSQHETAQGYVLQLVKPRQEKAFATYEMKVSKPSKLSKKVKLTVSSEAEGFEQKVWFNLEDVDVSNIKWELADEVSRSSLTIVVPRRASVISRTCILQKRQETKKQNQERKQLARQKAPADQKHGDIDMAHKECENLFRLCLFNSALAALREHGFSETATDKQPLASPKLTPGAEPGNEQNAVQDEANKNHTVAETTGVGETNMSSSSPESSECSATVSTGNNEEESQADQSVSERLKGSFREIPSTSQDKSRSQDLNKDVEADTHLDEQEPAERRDQSSTEYVGSS